MKKYRKTLLGRWLVKSIWILLLLGAGLTGYFFFRYNASQNEFDPPETLYWVVNGGARTLDPALANDMNSRDVVGIFYDTLLEYAYTERPYTLKPSMLETMPILQEDGKSYLLQLRDDLYFAPDVCFGADGGSPEVRKVRSQDVVYSILRIADSTLHSPAFWMLRGKLEGVDTFREQTELYPEQLETLYQTGIPGLKILNDREILLQLSAPDPRFLYTLAIPNLAVVSEKAVKYYGQTIAEHPVGSGPFLLEYWRRNYKLTARRNPEFRQEFFPEAADPADRNRPLPLVEKLSICDIRQPLTSWLLFLQGELDCAQLDKDNSDVVLFGGDLSPALQERGITLLREPEFAVQYIGFNFADPKLGKNLLLRRAIAKAYNIQRRIDYANGQLEAIQGPIPPGVAGCDPLWINLHNQYNLEEARKLLAEAGYPDGIDPETGEKLRLNFDQNGNTAFHRQMGEMMISDMAQLGIEIVANLNNTPRFFQKLQQNQLQLFRLSWNGDYPDGENFLQLFYGPNSGSSNRVNFSDPAYDAKFETIRPMPDSPERTLLYQEMVQYLSEQTPWIFESRRLMCRLQYPWVENYLPHDFAFSRWKFLAVDPLERKQAKASFRPLSFSQMTGSETAL